MQVGPYFQIIPGSKEDEKDSVRDCQNILSIQLPFLYVLLCHNKQHNPFCYLHAYQTNNFQTHSYRERQIYWISNKVCFSQSQRLNKQTYPIYSSVQIEQAWDGASSAF